MFSVASCRLAAQRTLRELRILRHLQHENLMQATRCLGALGNWLCLPSLLALLESWYFWVESGMYSGWKLAAVAVLTWEVAFHAICRSHVHYTAFSLQSLCEHSVRRVLG